MSIIARGLECARGGTRCPQRAGNEAGTRRKNPWLPWFRCIILAPSAADQAPSSEKPIHHESFCMFRLDLDVDRDCLADSGD